MRSDIELLNGKNDSAARFVVGADRLTEYFLLIYEHSLVRADDLTRVNMAFFNVNAIVSIGLFVVVTVDLMVI